MKKKQLTVVVNTDPATFGVGTYAIAGEGSSTFVGTNTVSIANPSSGPDGGLVGEDAPHPPENNSSIKGSLKITDGGKFVKEDDSEIAEGELAWVSFETTDGLPVISYIAHSEETAERADAEKEKEKEGGAEEE